eukprot:1032589-Rhodomonas_salina.1
MMIVVIVIPTGIPTGTIITIIIEVNSDLDARAKNLNTLSQYTGGSSRIMLDFDCQLLRVATVQAEGDNAESQTRIPTPGTVTSCPDA